MRLARIKEASDSCLVVVTDDEALLVKTLDEDGRPELTGERRPLEDVRLISPLAPRTIFGVGRNYVAHIEEMGYPMPERPSLFMKPVSSVIGPHGDVVLPPQSSRVEHEAEVALIIGREGRDILAADAWRHVLGVTCADDVSARDLQASDDSVIRGKGFDTFCPLGPWIETDVDIRSGLAVSCRVNGELRQQGHTSDLLFDLSAIVSYLSSFTTLRQGDVILTGSPGGSAALAPGDKVEIDVEGVGVLEHGVV